MSVQVLQLSNTPPSNSATVQEIVMMLIVISITAISLTLPVPMPIQSEVLSWCQMNPQIKVGFSCERKKWWKRNYCYRKRMKLRPKQRQKFKKLPKSKWYYNSSSSNSNSCSHSSWINKEDSLQRRGAVVQVKQGKCSKKFQNQLFKDGAKLNRDVAPLFD